MKRRGVLLTVALATLAALAACNIYVGNVRPIASFIANPTTGASPLDVHFDASASHDPDGTIEAYVWSFGDGQSASGVVTPTHEFIVQTDPETFTVTLTVTDNEGATDTDTEAITVDP